MNNTLLKSAVLIGCLLLLGAFTLVSIHDDVKFDKVVKDDPSRPLVENIQKLAAEAEGKGTVWIGYKLNVREKFKNSHIRIKHSHSISQINDEKQTYTTEKQFFYKFNKGEKVPSGLLLQQDYYKNDLEGLVIWIEGVSTQRSLDAAISFCEMDSVDDDARMVAAVAFHPGEKASNYLFEYARDEKDQERRSSGIFWYAQTLDGEGLGKLPELERIHKTRKDKESLIFAYSTLGNKAAYDRVKGYAFNSDDKHLVENAVFWMGQFEKVDPSADLMKLFEASKNNDIKEKIIFSLSQTESKAAGEFLIKIAKSSSDDDLRENAIFWLGQQQGADVLPLLKELYADAKSSDIKENILFSMMQLEDEKAFDFVSKIATGNGPASVREHAIFHLAQHTDKEKALDMLKKIFSSDNSAEIKKHALFAATQLDGEASAEFLEEVIDKETNGEVLHDAVFMLSQVSDEAKASKILAKLYNTRSEMELKKGIVFALGQSDNKESHRQLLNIAKNEKNKELKKEALFWLSQVDSEESAEVISAILDK